MIVNFLLSRLNQSPHLSLMYLLPLMMNRVVLGNLGDRSGLSGVGVLGDFVGLGDLGDLGCLSGMEVLGVLVDMSGLGDLGGSGGSG